MKGIGTASREASGLQLTLKPRLRTIAYLCFVMWSCVLLMLVVTVGGLTTLQNPGQWLSMVALLLFFGAGPLVVLRARIVVGDEWVALRDGLGRWQRIPRSDARAVVYARRPRIEGAAGDLVPHRAWSAAQLRELAQFLGVEFRNERRSPTS